MIEHHTAQAMRIILHSQPPTRPDVLAHLSTNLRRLRQERALNQASLGLQSGLSLRMISAIEGGAANVTLSRVDPWPPRDDTDRPS